MYFIYLLKEKIDTSSKTVNILLNNIFLVFCIIIIFQFFYFFLTQVF